MREVQSEKSAYAGWACALCAAWRCRKTQAPGLRSSGIPTWLTPRPEPLSFLKLNETWKRYSTQSEEGLSSLIAVLEILPSLLEI